MSEINKNFIQNLKKQVKKAEFWEEEYREKNESYIQLLSEYNSNIKRKL